MTSITRFTVTPHTAGPETDRPLLLGNIYKNRPQYRHSCCFQTKSVQNIMATKFTPKDNPAFILHGALNTSYETVSGG